MGTATETPVEAEMSTPLETISRDRTLEDATSEMRAKGINALLVPGAEMGIITSTDVLDAIAEGHDPATCQVADVMTEGIESITTETRVREAAEMMTTYGINHLPVRDSDGDYVGMVSSSDLTDRLSEE